MLVKPPQLVLKRLKQEGYKHTKHDWYYIPDPEGERWFVYLSRKENHQEKYYAATISAITGQWLVEILSSYHIFKVKDENN
jgi:hypothetical protein